MPESDYAVALGLPEEDHGGDAQNFDVRITRIKIQDGPALEIPKPGVTLMVGGNNAGKSTLLRQLHQHITSDWNAAAPVVPYLLSDIDLAVSGSKADAFAWLADRAKIQKQHFAYSGISVLPSTLNVVWSMSKGSGRLSSLGQVVTLAPNARSRFDAIQPAQRRSDVADPPALALHYFEDDPALMAELDGYSREIFNTGLTLDPISGKVILRYGDVGVKAPPVDRITKEYRDHLAALTPLDQQGDGVGSTLGLLIPLLAGRHPIALVDEPEAFLHPPQAFKLGQIIARIAEVHVLQVVVATHDRNFVAGVLSHPTSTPAVLRLERSGNKSAAHVVDPQELKDIWSSALLRHSNILDGLFHRAVVIAEQERDCLFYQAALEAVAELPGGLVASDVLFVSSHGKGGIPEIASILTSARVPVVAAVDLDGLRDVAALKKMLESVGGVWDPDLEKCVTRATAEFRVARKPVTKQAVLGSITAVLASDAKEAYDAEAQRAVRDALALDDPWSTVKKFGVAAFRAERKTADEAVERLQEQGIALVPVGELEGFAPALGVAKGRNWLPAALDASAHESEAAQAFAQTLAQAILSAEARPGVGGAALVPGR